jgi:hypothetical protein
MKPAELLNEVRALGVTVRTVGDRLRFEGPTGRITPAMREALAANKRELLDLLAQEGTTRTNATAEGGAAAPSVSRAVLLERVRQRLSPSLRQWDDEMLSPLLCWHVAVAFDRGGERDWRRWLPPALSPLTDGEITALVNWEELAAMERAANLADAEGAPALRRGATRLAAWWNARRDAERARGRERS